MRFLAGHGLKPLRPKGFVTGPEKKLIRRRVRGIQYTHSCT